jgi:hypothetical protein
MAGIEYGLGRRNLSVTVAEIPQQNRVNLKETRPPRKIPVAKARSHLPLGHRSSRRLDRLL